MATEHWTISRQFNISFLFGVLIQTVALVWFIAGIDAGVQENNREIIRNESRIETLERIVHNQAITMARIDENIKAIRDMMERR